MCTFTDFCVHKTAHSKPELAGAKGKLASFPGRLLGGRKWPGNEACANLKREVGRVPCTSIHTLRDRL